MCERVFKSLVSYYLVFIHSIQLTCKSVSYDMYVIILRKLSHYYAFVTQTYIPVRHGEKVIILFSVSIS